MGRDGDVVDIGCGMVDLSYDEIAYCGQVAAVRGFEPEGGFLGVGVEGAGGGGEDCGGGEVAEGGTEG